MKKTLPVLLLLMFSCMALRAQNAPAPASEPMTHVTVGQAIVPLYGPWKFHIGDNPQWANPSFDDSSWETVNLRPTTTSFDPITGWSGYVPGWTAKGHPGYWGYAWYRIRVRVNARPGERLGLNVAGNIDDVFQAFANGQLVGSFGKFLTGKSPVTYYSQPAMFQLPQATAEGPQTLVLAFRVWMMPTDLQSAPDAGGFHNAPLFGQYDAIAAGYELAKVRLERVYFSGVIEAALFFLLSFMALSLMFFDRSDRVYRWLTAVFLLTAVTSVYTCVIAWSQTQSIFTASVVTDVFMTPLVLGGWVMVWWRWFRLQRPSWMPKFIAVLTVFYMICDALGENLFFNAIPVSVNTGFHLASLGVRILFVPLLIMVVVWGVREQGREGWLALPAVILAAVSQFQTELSVLHVRVMWFPFGGRISLAQTAMLGLVAVMLILLVRRLLFSLRQQRQMALDVKQAQEIQQVILPGSITWFPGYAIESEYRPAREVGGDFFQILPHDSDGSMLIVVGDVTGKGLQAGMMVALLVGAIRSTADFDADPEIMLRALNRRLLGRGDAHATCLAMRITAGGEVTLANAGHLPPYLNGKPLDIQGALPLGLAHDADFSVLRFTLAEGDRLILVSDGIAEAMDSEGRLFGFERVEQMLAQNSSALLSASALADAAQQFGQEDDISVISVTRAEVLKPVLV
ncbi:MAG: SpoIIE family protein phosphatase [Acidobacteriaceae bacterium]